MSDLTAVGTNLTSIQEVFISEFKKLVDQGLISAETAEFPDLGEIPEPDPLPAEEEEEDDEEDDEDDEDGDDSDDGGRRRRRSRKSKKEQNEPVRKKRGRPPRVDTPMEARIKAILKGIRKFKDNSGQLKIRHFERLPDKTMYPDYYVEIKEPMAIDMIKRKAKRKKYTSVDHFMRDLDLMFENAKTYNQPDSQLYKDAVDLQREAHKLAEQEKKKPDSDYMMEDGRIPLPDGIHYNGEVWKVGDWVHIQNPNDVTKPIVAQIYRTWQDAEGDKWINACWYYRPEQTVHHYEKRFYPNEVVKTGQYRDHRVEEIVDRCFVMFFTRYSRGRPRGFPPDKEVYVCEARYNEEKHKLNKIKTWASCLPDEVRDKDYEMDLFDVPRKIKKVPSPIKHLLKPDAKETDELPKPTWGAQKAPPLVGAVHCRPRDENESPPPEPTPSPPPPPPAQPVSQQQQQQQQPVPAATVPTPTPTTQPATRPGSSQAMPAQTRPPSAVSTTGSVPTPPVVPSQATYQPQPVPSPAYQQQPPPPPLQSRPANFTPAASPAQAPQQPPQPQPQPQPQYRPAGMVPPQQYTPTPPPPAAPHHHPPPTTPAAPAPAAYTGYNTNPANRYQPAPLPPQQPPAAPPAPIPATTPPAPAPYNPNAPRPIEVFHLSDTANAAIPASIRAQFHQDDQGRVLFFSTPPLDIVSGKGANLGHSLKYLAAREEREKARRAAANNNNNSKRPSPGKEQEPDAKRPRIIRPSEEEVTTALAKLTEQILSDTSALYKTLYGSEGAEEMQRLDAEKRARGIEEDERKRRRVAALVSSSR